MGEDIEELQIEVEEERESKVSRFVDFINRVLEVFENIPKAILGISLVVSLIAGGTGAWGAIVSPEREDIVLLEQQIMELKQETRDLRVWNEALREITQALLTGANIRTEKIEFEGFLLDMSTGEIEPLKPKGK